MSPEKSSPIKLSDHFTYRRLLRFVYPSVVMMIFTSIYTVVDGLFVSNFVGKTPFAALNLIYPYIALFGTLGFMFGSGGSALVSKTLGEGREEKARRYFSLIVYTSALSGILLAVIGVATVPAVARLLGAEGDLLSYSILYGRILICATPLFVLQNVFQSFFVTAQKPKLGLLVIVLAGCTNIVLDFLFIAVLGFGLAGAASATAIAQAVGGLFSLLYFVWCRPQAARRRNSPGCSRAGSGAGRIQADQGTNCQTVSFPSNRESSQAAADTPACSSGQTAADTPPSAPDRRSESLLYLTATTFEGRVLLQCCHNGLSEFVSNMSMSAVNMLYNYQLMKFSGENGVSAFGVVQYVAFFFLAIFLGYAIGCSPIIGYHYGAQNVSELQNMFRKSLILMFVSGICMTGLAIGLAVPFSRLFVGYDTELLALTTRALRLYAISYMLAGFNIFGSSFFTSLNNGNVSAAISILRLFGFQALAVFLMPALIGLNGIWLAAPCAELLTLAVTIFFFIKMRGRYHYA